MEKVKQSAKNNREAVAQLQKQLTEADDFFLADYRGLTVEQMGSLRRDLRSKGARFRVVKNSFAKRAFAGIGIEGLDEALTGPTAVAMVSGDVGAVAKVLLEHAADKPLAVKYGIVAGAILQSKEVEALSKLPSKLELIQQLMGTMMAPVQQLARVMIGVPEKFVRTLSAVADKKNEA